MLRSLLRGAGFVTPAALAIALALTTPASAVQRTVTIQQIQDTTSVGHVVVGSTDTVTTTGVITGADQRGSGFGFYIQDPAGGDYSGVLVFTGGANVFCDMGLARGDLVRVTGRTTEFSNETEIISLTGGAFNAPPTVTKIGTAPLPAPIALADFDDIAEIAGYFAAERYEGVRVSIANARTTNTSIGLANQWLVVDDLNPSLSVRIDGQTLCLPGSAAPAVGLVATSVQGIGYERTPRGYGIQLRDGGDIVAPSPPVLLNAYAISNTQIQLVFDRGLDLTTAQDIGNYSRSITLKAIDAATVVNNQFVNLTTAVEPQVPGESEAVTAENVQSTGGVPMTAAATQSFRAGIVPIQMVQTNAPGRADTSQYVGQQVTVHARIQAIDEGLYYFQDGTGSNPSSGMAVFAPICSMAEGDEVTMSGVVTEFGGASQLTEFSGLDYQIETSTGNAKYDPVPVSPMDIGPQALPKPFVGERYEAMLVRISNLTVVQDSLPNGQFKVQGAGGAGDTVRVDDTMYRSNILYDDGVGRIVQRIDGVLNDAFGMFTVNPRRQSDLVIEPVGVPNAPVAVEFAIRSIQPTPTSFGRGAAIINFVLPSAGSVSARVYDLAGRLVAKPFSDVALGAGPQSLGMDGKTLAGGQLGSGIYFVQLELGNSIATSKLIVAE